MRLQLTARHGSVPDSVREYVERKLAKLERRVHDATLIEVVLARETNPKIADDHIVEATIHTKGPSLHGREAAVTYEAATDRLVDKLERQVERYRDKRVHERRRRSAGREPTVAAPPPVVPGEEPAA